MKKSLRILGVIVVVLALIYGVGTFFFSNHFVLNTQVAGIDVSGLTTKQAEKKIEKNLNMANITLKEEGKSLQELTLGDLNPSYDFAKEIKESFDDQDPYLWLESIFNRRAFAESFEDNYQIDANKVVKEINQTQLDGKDREKPVDSKIAYSEEQGYYIEEGSQGTLLDTDKLEDSIKKAVDAGKDQLDLKEAYADPDQNSDSKKVKDRMKSIEEVSSKEFTFNLAGDKVKVDQTQIERWMNFDDDKKLVMDREAIAAYLTGLNDKYSTFGQERTFESTLQGEIIVPPGILGWQIDVEEETEIIASSLESGKSVPEEPIYYSTGGTPGAKDDIGDTYIEIDLINQTMFLYVDGSLITETPIVSGQLGAETVPGANAVNEMLADTNLVGYNQFYRVDYSVPVSYWIRFDDQDQGIHDAPWQGSYGGDVYQYSGSLGCINTPLDQVEIIYNNVQYGTPVIVFN